MTIAYPTVRHRCEFCRKSYASVSVARKHEADCYRNPATASCPTCVHFQPVFHIDCDLGLGEYERPTHPADDGRFIWQKRCESWSPRAGAVVESPQP